METTVMRHRLTVPKDPTSRAVMLLPGLQGQPLSSYYEPLAKGLQAAGIAFLQFECWKTSEECNEKTPEDIEALLIYAGKYLASAGYTQVGCVGKSIGGALALMLPQPNINAYVLWAPAVHLGEKSTLAAYKNKPLREREGLVVSKEDLKKTTAPVLLVQGTSDSLLATSEKLQKLLPHATLKKIEGADHSYEKPEEMQRVVEATVNFLKKTL